MVHFEAMNERGLEQFLLVFEALQKQAATVLPDKHSELGQLVAIDGSLIGSSGDSIYLTLMPVHRLYILQSWQESQELSSLAVPTTSPSGEIAVNKPFFVTMITTPMSS